jgi:hypothetical protein
MPFFLAKTAFSGNFEALEENKAREGHDYLPQDCPTERIDTYK